MSGEMGLLGIAKKAGRLEIGDDSVSSAARTKKARVILTASDISAGSLRRAENFAEIGNTIHLSLPYTKFELGSTVGRGSPGILAITDIGIASSFVSKLAASDPAKYGSAAELLAKKSARALLRKRETRAHEQNIRTGNRRTK